MKKNVIYVIIALALIAVGAYVLRGNYKNGETATTTEEAATDGGVKPAGDISSTGYKNIAYTIEGKMVTLKNGVAVTQTAPDSVSKTTTRYFGNHATGDLNGDGRNDVAFILTQDAGGTGIFYYVAAAIRTDAGYWWGTNGVFLGDRIAPQTTEIRNGEIIVNYATRLPGEPMTAKPSLGVSKYFKISGAQLVGVVR